MSLGKDLTNSVSSFLLNQPWSKQAKFLTMGSAPSDDIIKALQGEAYAALLRAIYAHPGQQSDPLVRAS